MIEWCHLKTGTFMLQALLISIFNYNLLKLQPPTKLQLNCGDKSCQTVGKSPNDPASALVTLRETSVKKQTRKEIDKRATFC